MIGMGVAAMSVNAESRPCHIQKTMLCANQPVPWKLEIEPPVRGSEEFIPDGQRHTYTRGLTPSRVS
jgi:hypothetical protein